MCVDRFDVDDGDDHEVSVRMHCYRRSAQPNREPQSMRTKTTDLSRQQPWPIGRCAENTCKFQISERLFKV